MGATLPLAVTDVWRAAVAAGVTAAAVTPVIAWLARRWHILDRPAGYKAHAVATPLLGGCAVVLGAVVGIGSCVAKADPGATAGLLALALGVVIILVVGVVDDSSGLAPRHKFAWQLVAAAGAGLCLALLGVRLNLFLHWPPVPIILLTVLWVVGITNAVNFLDNMNGLCAGLGGISAAALAVANARSGEMAVALAAAALAGACVGFLPYNWPKARIFLGDAGSMVIGFLLAGLSVMGVYTRGAQVPILAVCAPLFVLGIPVLDSLLVVLLRVRVGHPPWVGDRRHISHRLVRRGMQPATAVATLWAAGAACGMAALLLPSVGALDAPLLLLLMICALGALAAAAGTRGLD